MCCSLHRPATCRPPSRAVPSVCAKAHAHSSTTPMRSPHTSVLALAAEAHSQAAPMRSPHTPALALAAKEIEDRRVGLAKKQKLDPAAEPAEPAAGGEPSGSAAAEPAAGGDVEMTEGGAASAAAAEGGSGSATEAAAAANGAGTDYAGQLTGGEAAWLPCVAGCGASSRRLLKKFRVCHSKVPAVVHSDLPQQISKCLLWCRQVRPHRRAHPQGPQRRLGALRGVG